MFFEIDVLKNFAIFTGKHLRWSLLLIKLQACNFLVNIAKFLKSAFFIKHLWWLLLKNSKIYQENISGGDVIDLYFS